MNKSYTEIVETYKRVILSQPFPPRDDSSEWELLHVNCYAVALQLKMANLSPFLHRIAPGFLTKEITSCIFPTNILYPEHIIRGFKRDCHALGRSCRKTTLHGKIPPNSYKVAVYCKPGRDFHFIRQNSDGTWFEINGWDGDFRKVPEQEITRDDDGYQFLGIYAISQKG